MKKTRNNTTKKQITDKQLLRMIKRGDITYNNHTEQLFVMGRALKERLMSSEQKRYGYSLKINGNRRTIVRSRIVYMCYHQILIPEGFEIHHIENHLNDKIDNLVMVTMSDHLKLHGNFEIQLDDDEVPF